jgi:hypothetical protein
MTDLPADYTRCMGETPICPQRETCARFRDLPHNTMLSWSRNLNIEGCEECLHYIPYPNLEQIRR